MEEKSSVLRGSSRSGDEDSVSARLLVDAGVSIERMRNLQGAAGMPGPAPGAEQIPDLVSFWESARIGLVRTYDWVSRLDTVDNPDSLFPKWSADPRDPASYNFVATDSWVRQVQAIGAEIIFTIASAVPSNKLPTSDLAKYDKEEATASDNLSSRLPYMFATSRFAHYLKCMVRDQIGETKEKEELQKWLQTWITQYVDGDPKNSTTAIKARKPLAAAKVDVFADEENPGY